MDVTFAHSNKYTVKDDASLILRYIKLLPEPVVTYDCYQSFLAILDSLPSNIDPLEKIDWSLLDETTREITISTAPEALKHLPRNNRCLLFYFLVLIHNFAKESNKNLLDTPQLVVVFQPGLLSLEPEEMSIYEHRRVHQVIESIFEDLDAIPWVETYYSVLVIERTKHVGRWWG